FADLAETARAALAEAENVSIVVGDGSEGLGEPAPFDALLVNPAYALVAPPHSPLVPPPLAQQLAEGGRLVQPIGHGGDEDVVLFEKRGSGLHQVRVITGGHFVRPHGRY